MEEKFYLDDFELSLQEQANQFKMVPAKKVWHGIYNDIHPGRRWPSFMVALILISSIVFIGHINSYTDKKPVNLNLQAPVINNGKDVSKPSITNEARQLLAKPIDQKNDRYKVEDSNPDKVNTSLDRNVSIRQISQTDHSLPVATSLPNNYSGSKKENNSPQDNVIIENSIEDNTPKVISNLPDVLTYTKGLENSLVQHSYKSLPLDVPEFINVSSTYNKIIVQSSQTNSKINLSESDKAALVAVKKKNDKISWVYYATPFVSSVSLKGAPLKENTNLNISPLPQVAQKDMKVIRNAALGFEAGAQMNYSLSAKLQFTTGAHVTLSGYNIVSNLVHPTLSTLTLRNSSTGDTYSRNFVTHYGDGTGKSPVTLHNYSYQASIPAGLQYAMWDNEKFQVNLAADFEPSFVFKADAYLLSSDGKNYVNVPNLMRKWNFSSNFAPFVSFRSSKFKWNIGPNIRYQWLSTYQKNYTVKEHLIDYGIRVGISK